MIPLARRFCAVTLAILGAAALLLAWHRVAIGTNEPCADPAQLAHLAAFGARHSSRVDSNYDGIRSHWVDGELVPLAAKGLPLAFRFFRSVEPHRFYEVVPLLPRRALPEDRSELLALSVGSDVLPVHRRFDDSFPEIRVTHYFYALGLRPVSHPLLGGLALAWEQLARGNLPVSLFAISAIAEAPELAKADERARSWIAEAWTEYKRVCRP